MEISESYSFIQCYRVRKVINHEKADTIYSSGIVRVRLRPVIEDNARHKPIIVRDE